MRKMDAQQQQWYMYALQRAQAMGHPYPQAFAAKLLQESSFNPRAVSPAGALGIAQFMPGTAREMGLADPYDPYAAIDASVRYDLKNMGRLQKAGVDPSVQNLMAAYNAGPDVVIQHKGVPNFKETQNYVKAITGTPPISSAPIGGGSQLYGYQPNAPQPLQESAQYTPVQPAPPYQQPAVGHYADTLDGIVRRAEPTSLSQFYNGIQGRMYGGA